MTWLGDDDRKKVLASGRRPAEVEEALTRLQGEPAYTVLDRPAVVGDGLMVLHPADHGRLETLADAVAAEGRVSSFVPASGAATRLCAALWDTWEATRDRGGVLPDAVPEVAARVLWETPRMALWSELQAHGAVAGDPMSILEAMFGDEGMGLHRRPKGLVPFHRYGDVARTAFDEHVAEASMLAADVHGVTRVHMTVAPEHRAGFQAAADRVRDVVEDVSELALTLSVQDPSTDMPALTESGEPFRLDDGSLFFRPGGHGALLGNLQACGGDLVLVKNVDNVVRADLRGPVVPWRKRLLGLLAACQAEAFALVEALERGARVEEAQRFVAEVLGLSLPADASVLIDRLHRPWRVAGMVETEGQPGGGPFWAEGPDGITLQIVEGAQIDASSPSQQAALARATHFNPVDLALGLRDRHGQPWDLSAFTDPDARLYVAKTHEGTPLRCLEHPGLWNGQMARWNTLFVEIPAELFQPVKTLSDLLGEGHTESQPARSVHVG